MLAGEVLRYSVTWWGYGAVVAGLAVCSVIILVQERDRWSLRSMPPELLAFVALITVSIAWSAYPSASAIGVFTTWLTVLGGTAIAVAFSWQRILWGLGVVLRAVLAGSLAFELWVSLVVRHPVLPLWVNYPDGPLPLMLFWSRNVLLEGGKIQGLVGNSSLLAFLALLGVIVFAVQWADARCRDDARSRRVRRLAPLWLVLAVALIAATRSPTIYVAAAAVAGAVIVLLLARRAPSRASRIWVGVGSGVVAAAGAAALFAGGGRLLELVGKSPTLTGRSEIWATVAALAEQRPVWGWGWVSYWPPWVWPFDSLVTRNGVVQLHAHNAWLDVWLQVGLVGVIIFAACVLAALVRAFRVALAAGWGWPVSVLPLAILVALMVQSAAESRLLVEYGLLLLVVVSVSSRAWLRDRRVQGQVVP